MIENPPEPHTAKEAGEHVDSLYRRFHFANVILQIFVSVSLAITLGLLVYNSTTGRAARIDQGKTLETASESLRLLVECTTAPELRDPPENNVPATDCYSRQQKATASFTAPDGPFASLVAAAAACGAANPDDIPATRKCVIAALS